MVFEEKPLEFKQSTIFRLAAVFNSDHNWVSEMYFILRIPNKNSDFPKNCHWQFNWHCIFQRWVWDTTLLRIIVHSTLLSVHTQTTALRTPMNLCLSRSRFLNLEPFILSTSKWTKYPIWTLQTNPGISLKIMTTFITSVLVSNVKYGMNTALVFFLK